MYRGRPATHTCYIAVAWDDRIQVELMQPISGYSIYDEFLETKGEGLHHVKLFHADCAKAVAEYERRGYPVIQSGKFDEDEHYYLDTEKDFGYIIELGNAGKIREAERRYPA
jgi:methylmalonyl-CoA/ethylmalonyl-CoA epimerase